MDNAIISMLHHYFAHHRLGEKVVHLHTVDRTKMPPWFNSYSVE